MPIYRSANGARASGACAGGGVVARPSAAAGGSLKKGKKLHGAPARRNAAEVPASEGQEAPPVSGSESPCAAAGGGADCVASGSGRRRRNVAPGSGSGCVLLPEAGESERGTGDFAPSTADEFTAVSPTDSLVEGEEGSGTQADGNSDDDSAGADASSRDDGNMEAAGDVGEPSHVPAVPDPLFLLSTAVAPPLTESAEPEAVPESGAAPLGSVRREEVKAKAKRRNPVVKPVTAEKLEAFKQAQDRTGVVFLSRLPPFMKPQKVRHMLEKFGEIGRLYLAAEGAVGLASGHDPI
ncbi:MAG: hypothetical protein BJ554DRAFT_7336 [Olpidium bornovanus]|uniref:RRM domain-containing protein n=1 Tax=Olpidium bornovanus TaxID=278681 RepID=A0A8H8DJ73_9FUNG|nr:MAG: hypothetical protein BJ554DRAFT_7336 [Olpidium bornovanus]